MAQIILASASPRRHEILLAGGIRHSVVTADTDEALPHGTPPRRTVELLSQRKAEAVRNSPAAADAAKWGSTVVIGADTIVEFNGEILGKPRSVNDARRMLSSLSGNTHRVYTGMTVTDGVTSVTEVTVTAVTMGDISDKEIDMYISGSPMDKAGAYGIQEFGGRFVTRIDGDFLAVAGLSLSALCRILKENFGIVPPME
jgi:septum formation protein